MSLVYSIRFIEQEDIPDLISLCEAHAEYEREEYDPVGKAEPLIEALFSQPPKFYCKVIEHDQQLKGFISYMEQYSTWGATSYMYMDCLFLTDEIRGMGIGKQLMIEMKKHAKELGIELMQWQTPSFNERAIRFYHRMGSGSKPKERFFWLNK